MKNKYQGFTLIECLVALSFMSLFFAALSGIIPQSQKINQQLLDRQELEWQVCLRQIDAIFLLGKLKEVTKSEVIFERYKLDDKGNKVEMHLKRTDHNKRVILSNSGGNEPLLTQVANLTFKHSGKEITMQVTYLNGVERVGQWTIQE